MGGFHDDVARMVFTHEPYASFQHVIEREPARTQLIATAGREQVLLAVLRSLLRRGVDLDGLAIRAETYTSLPSAKVLPEPSDSRVSLRTLHDVLSRHADLILETAEELAARLPYAWVAAYGGALALGYPSYRDRTRNDLDLFARDDKRAQAIVDTLTLSLGFSLIHSHRSEFQGTVIAHQKLRRMHKSGHLLWVDLFTRGRPTGGSLTVPIVNPSLFESAVRIETQSGGVLIPSAEDMLILLAEKVLRRGTYHLRSTLDARAILLASPSLDWDAVCSGAFQLGVTPSLAWLLDSAERSVDANLALPDHRQLVKLAMPDRVLLGLVSRSARRPVGRFQPSQAIQLRLWLARYVLRSATPLATWRSLRAERSGTRGIT